MLYLNQLKYSSIPYPCNTSNPEDEWGRNASIKEAGCGLCSACMVVDQLSTKKLSLREARDLSTETGANWARGTDMKILAQALAFRFDLIFSATDNITKLIHHLREGGRAIVNVGGDHDGYKGVFSHDGHYMELISYKRGWFCLLDPSQRKDKYDKGIQEGKVRVNGHFIYASEEILKKETENRSPAFYMFARK